MERQALDRASRRQAELYHKLLRELGGPHGRQIQQELGPANIEVYDAIRNRLRARAEGLERDAQELVLDAIDWAAIRVIAPAILRHAHPPEFKMTTNFTFDDVVELERLAREHIHEFRSGPDFVSLQVGACSVSVPSARLLADDRGGAHVVGVPDRDSWDRVMPECARGRRDEFIELFQDHLIRWRGEWLFEERAVGSYEELEAWVAERGRPYRDFAAERRRE